MNFTQKHALVALIAVTLIASGCGQQPNDDEGSQGSSTAPIVVQEFKAFPNPAPANNEVTFSLKLLNTGEIDATKVVAKLWNPPFAQGSGDSRTWRLPGGGGAVSRTDRSMAFETLRGAEEGVESFAKPKNVRLQAPDLQDGQNFPYNFMAKIYYRYRTEGSTTIKAMTSEYYREQGVSKERSVPISHNSAPITLNGQLLTGNPVVFYESGVKKPQFCVVVKNAGSGTVFSRGAFSSNTGSTPGEYTLSGHENKVSLSMEVLGSTQVKLPDESDDSSNWQTTKTKTVELVGGDRVRQCFDLKIDGLASAGEQKEIGPINIKATYGYAKNAETTVTVNGRK